MTVLKQLVIVLIVLNGAKLQSTPYTVSVVGREANDVTLRCSISGSIVQNPDFWVNLTDATFRSMLDGLGVEYQYRGDDGELQFSMQQDLEGYYYCGDDISSGRISNNVTLLAYPLPVPDLQTDYAVKAGESIRLPCEVEPGALASHYSVQWRMGNVALDTTNPGPRLSIDWSDFSLMIENAQPSDENDYRCRVHVRVPSPGNDFQGPDTTLSLSVYKKPEILMVDPPQRVENIVEGTEKDADFLCKATGKPRPDTIQWMHNSRRIPEQGDARFTVSPLGSTTDSMTSRLSIHNIKPMDSGTVRCVASSTITLPGDKVEILQDNRTAILTVLSSDEMELRVTITTEEMVQLRLTYPPLRFIPTLVKLKILFIDAVEFRAEEKVENGEMTDSGDITYEDRAPYQRFRVQVALVVGNVTGPMVPQSLEDAPVYDLTKPSVDNPDYTVIVGTVVGGAILISAVIASTVILLICRRQQIRQKNNLKFEEQAQEHEKIAREATDEDERKHHFGEAKGCRERIVPDNEEEEGFEQETAGEMVANGNTHSGHAYPPADTGELPSRSNLAVANEYTTQPTSHPYEEKPEDN